MFALGMAILLYFAKTETTQQMNSVNYSSIQFLSVGLENCLQLRIHIHIQMQRMFANGQTQNWRATEKMPS